MVDCAPDSSSSSFLLTDPHHLTPPHHDQHWDDGWRISYGGKGFFSILLMVLMFWLPESPRWLVGQDRDEEVRGSLCD